MNLLEAEQVDSADVSTAELHDLLATCEKQLFWGWRVDFCESGLRRLMVALFLRTVKDVYNPDELVCFDAKKWLRENAVAFMHRFEIKLSHERICTWIREDFPREMVDMNFHNYFRSGGNDGED